MYLHAKNIEKSKLFKSNSDLYIPITDGRGHGDYSALLVPSFRKTLLSVVQLFA